MAKFTKGTSGNPAGRPRRSTTSSAAKTKRLMERCEAEIDRAIASGDPAAVDRALTAKERCVAAVTRRRSDKGLIEILEWEWQTLVAPHPELAAELKALIQRILDAKSEARIAADQASRPPQPRYVRDEATGQIRCVKPDGSPWIDPGGRVHGKSAEPVTLEVDQAGRGQLVEEEGQPVHVEVERNGDQG